MNTGIGKRMLCLALALCAGFVMSGCTGKSGEEKAPSPTLAPAVVDLKAPDGDRAVRKAGDYTIYLAGPNELQLRTQTVLRTKYALGRAFTFFIIHRDTILAVLQQTGT